MGNEKITVKDFGKDHWSMLEYIGYRAMNHKGVLNTDHMRLKNRVGYNGCITLSEQKWEPGFGTRLSGYFLKGNKVNEERLLPQHDDYDCIDDLENEKLVKNFGTGMNPACLLEKRGLEALRQLTDHKQKGGWCSNFTFIE